MEKWSDALESPSGTVIRRAFTKLSVAPLYCLCPTHLPDQPCLAPLERADHCLGAALDCARAEARVEIDEEEWRGSLEFLATAFDQGGRAEKPQAGARDAASLTGRPTWLGVVLREFMRQIGLWSRRTDVVSPALPATRLSPAQLRKTVASVDYYLSPPAQIRVLGWFGVGIALLIAGVLLFGV